MAATEPEPEVVYPDDPTLNVSGGGVTAEGGNLSFIISLDETAVVPVGEQATVVYTFTGAVVPGLTSAASPSDLPTPEPVVITAGNRTANVTVLFPTDRVIENREGLIISIVSVTFNDQAATDAINGNLPSPSPVEIIDRTRMTVGVQATDATEGFIGDPGVIVVTAAAADADIRLERDVPVALIVNVGTARPSAPNRDYQHPGGVVRLTFEQGVFPVSATMGITVIPDSIREPTAETVLIQLSASQDQALVPDRVQATANIRDNDVRVRLSVSPGTVDEDGGAPVVTISLVSDTDGNLQANRPATLNIPYSITGIQAPDLVSGNLDGTVAITSDTFADQTLSIASDLLVEGPETATITVSRDDLPPGLSLDGDAALESVTTTFTIADSDALRISFAGAPYTFAEGGSNYQAVVDVQPIAGDNLTLVEDASISFMTVNGTAIAGNDYTALNISGGVPAILYFSGISTPLRFPVIITDDNVVEEDETFNLLLTSSDSRLTPSQLMTAVTILSNDPGLTRGVAEERTVPLTELQSGYMIDPGVMVNLGNLFNSQASTLGVTVAADLSGDADLNNLTVTTDNAFPPLPLSSSGDSIFFGFGSAGLPFTQATAQSSLRLMTLTLDPSIPPDAITVTMAVRPFGGNTNGSDDISVAYTLNIRGAEPEPYPTSFTVTVENDNDEVRQGDFLELLLTLNRAVPSGDKAIFMLGFGGDGLGEDRRVVIEETQSTTSIRVFVSNNDTIENNPVIGTGRVFIESVTFELENTNTNLSDYYDVIFNLGSQEREDTVEPPFTILDGTKATINIIAGRAATADVPALDGGRIVEGYLNASGAEHSLGIRVIANVLPGVNLERAVTVNLVVGGGQGDTVEENDYSHPENGTLTLTIPNGAQAGFVDIATTPDFMREPGGEMLTLAFAQLQDDPAVVLGSTTLAVVTIHDNEALVSVARVSPGTVSEDNVNSRILAIIISDSDRPPGRMVGYTVTGIDQNDLDGISNSPLEGDVSFSPTVNTINRSFLIFADNLVEGPETMTITVQRDDDLPPGFSLAGDANLMSVSTSITILDATPPLEVSFAQTAYNVDENVGDVTVVLNVISGEGVNSTLVSMVEVTVTSATDDDFSISNPTIDIVQGQYTATARQFSFTLSIVDDLIMEDEETFTLNLTPSDDRIVVTGESTQASVVIAANDQGQPPIDTPYPSSYSVVVTTDENNAVTEGQPLELTFTLNNPVPAGDTLTLNTSITIPDANNPSVAAIFESGENTKIVNVPFPVDNRINADRTAQVDLAFSAVSAVLDEANDLSDFVQNTLDPALEPTFTIVDATTLRVNISVRPRLANARNEFIEGFIGATNDDNPPIVVTVDSPDQGNINDQDNISIANGRVVTVLVAVGGGRRDSVELNDYTPPPNGLIALTIDDLGDLSATTEVFTTPDVMREPGGERLTIALAPPSSQTDTAVVLGSVTSAVVTILDNDLFLSATRVSQEVTTEDDASNKIFSLVFSSIRGAIVSTGGNRPALRIPYRVSGINPADLFPEAGSASLSGSVEFDTGDVFKQLGFRIYASDNLVEGTETATITVLRDELPPGLSFADENARSVTATLTILDATPPLRVSFDEMSYSFAEDAGNVEAVLNVLSGAGQNVTLTETIFVSVVGGGGTAGLGTDYSIANTMVEISSGAYTTSDTPISVPLSIIGDNVEEFAETFTLTLTSSDNRANVVEGDNDVATVTIQANDGQVTVYPTTVSVRLVSSDETPDEVEENTGLMFRVELNLPVPAGDTATVMYSLDGRAGLLNAPVGFTAPDDIPAGGMTTIVGPAQVATVTVTVSRDTLLERNESGVVVIDTVTFGTSQPAFDPVEAPFVITNATPSLDVLFNVSGFYQTREDAGDFAPGLSVRGSNVILVSTISASVVTRDTGVGLTSATAGEDYTALTIGNGQVDIPPGTYGPTGTNIPILLSITSDSTVESDESFSLDLTISDDRVTETFRQGRVDVEIVNDDATVEFNPQTVTVQPRGSMDVTVRLSDNLASLTDYSVTLNLTPESGLTLNGLAAYGVELSNTTLTEVVTIAAPMGTAERIYDVTVAVVDPQGVTVVTPVPALRVTVGTAVPYPDQISLGIVPSGRNIRVAEGADLMFEITLNEDVPLGDTATVTYAPNSSQPISGIAAFTSDGVDVGVIGGTVTVTIAGGQRSTTISVRPIADSIVEPDESGSLALKSVTFESDTPEARAAAVALDEYIRDSFVFERFIITDATEMAVSLAVVGPESVSEGFNAADFNSTIVVTATRADDVTLSRDVIVRLDFDGTAEPNDYVRPGGRNFFNLTFSEGDAAVVATANITVTPDTILETGETVIIELNDSQDQDQAVVAGETTRTSVTILDNDLQVSVSGGGAVNEGDDAVFTVTLSGAARHPALTIPYAVSEIDSNDVDTGSDLLTGDVIIGASQSFDTLTYRTRIDNDLEGPETARITVLQNRLPLGLSFAVSDAQVTADITINDVTRDETVTFTESMVTVERGAPGVETTVSLVPLLNPGQSATLRLTSAVPGLTVNNEAVLDVMLDDVTQSQAVMIAATASVAPGDYMVTVEVLNPVGVAEVTLTPLMVTVQPGSIVITQDPSRATINVREPELQDGITIDSGVTVTSIEQFTTVLVVLTAGDTNGNLGGAMINDMALGVDGVTFTVGGARDSAALRTLLSELELILGTRDPPDVAIVTVTVRSEAHPAAEDTVLTYTLNITDTPELISADLQNLVEGEEVGGVTLTLNRQLAPGETVTVTYNLQNFGSGANSEDIIGPDIGTVEISDPANTISIDLRANDDQEMEGRETFDVVFEVEFEDAVGTATVSVAGFSPQTLTILASDAPEGTYPTLVNRVTRASMDVTEGGDQMFTVELNSAVPDNDTATVVYSLIGVGGINIAADIVDITNGEATIEAGQSTVAVSLNVPTDGVVENTEVVEFSITMVTFETSSTASFGPTIANQSFNLLDATQMTVNLAVASTSVPEGFNADSFRSTIDVMATATGVTLDRDVDVRLVFGGGADENDYDRTPLVLIFAAAPAELEATASIAVTPDTIEETAVNEVVTIAFDGTQDDRAVVAGTLPGDVTIVDNDLRVSVTGAGSVNEGQSAVFTVTLSGAAAHPDLVIPYAVTGIVSADVNMDTSASLEVGSTLTISTGETAGDLTYVMLVDDLVEGTETAQIELLRSNLPAGLLLDAAPNIDEVTATIEIRDETRLRVSFNNTPYSFAENDVNPDVSLLVRGVLSDVRLLSAVFVTVETDADTAVAGDDYVDLTGDSARIRIPAATYTTVGTSTPVSLVLVNDEIVEGTETFDLVLSTGNAPLELLNPARVSVEIRDDDESGAAVTFNPAAVTLAGGESVAVTVGTNPPLIEGQSVTLDLTAVQGVLALAVDGLSTDSVDLDAETTSRVVNVSVAGNASPGEYQVTVAASNPVGLTVTSLPPLMVTVSGIVITQTDPNVLRPGPVTESDLQGEGILIDNAIMVALFEETISTIDVAIVDSNGDIVGAEFDVTTNQGFNETSGRQYTATTGATAMEAQDLLQTLRLTLATQTPPTRATVTVTVTPSGGSGVVTAVYPLNITDENEPPTVVTEGEGLTQAPDDVNEDSGRTVVDIAIVDPVEPGQSISSIEVVASTIMANSNRGTAIGDLLVDAIDSIFSVDNTPGPTTVTFTGTLVDNAHGTAEFALQAMDSAGGASPVFLFTLTVNSVNDAPVVNVTEEMLNLTGGGRSATDTVSVTLTDVDVSAAAGNVDRFAQAGDTLMMSVSTDVVTLTLPQAMLTQAGEAMLNGNAVADVAGNGSSQTTLTFTSGLTAAQVQQLAQAVAVSVGPDVGSGVGVLTVTLTTGLNEDTGDVRTDPLPGSDTVQVNVSEAGAPLNFSGAVADALTEGQTGDAVTLSFSRRLEENESVTVTYTLDFADTAELGDITDPNNGEVTLAQGQNVVSIQLEANTDINVEGEETFAVQYTATFTNNEGTERTIANQEEETIAINDRTPPLQVSFSEAGYTFAEDTGPYEVTLNVVSGGANATLDSLVQVSVETGDGTALLTDSDYTQLTGNSALVDILAGPYTAATAVPITVALSITVDTDVEPDEMFTLTLFSNDARAVGSAEVAVTIRNDDVRDETVMFDQQQVTVERGGSSVDVDVSLDPLLIPGQAATLRLTPAQGLTVNGSATTYDVALDGNTNTTSEVVMIAAASNADLGSPEVTVTLLAGSVGVGTVPPASLTVMVQPGSIAIAQGRNTIMIGEVDLQAGTTIDETITVTSVETFTTARVTLTGDANGDLVGAEINRMLGTDSTFDINGDAAALQTFLSRLILTLGTRDPPEVATVTVTVRPEAHPAAPDIVLAYRLEITDVPELSSVTPENLDEDNAAVGGVTLVLDRALEAGETVVVSYTLDFSANSASSGDVTDSNPGSVTINTGDTISIDLPAIDDNTPETEETFNVVFTSIEFITDEETVTIDASGDSPQTLTIPANDYPNSILSVTRVSPVEVSEGESLMLRVELNAAVPANETATVMYAVGGDIAITDGEATIAAEQTFVVVAVAVDDDTVVENNEEVTVFISRVNFVATAGAGFDSTDAINFTLVDATQMTVNLAVASASVAEGFDADGFRNSIEVTASVVAGVTLDRDVDVRLVFGGTAGSDDYAQPQVGSPLVLTFVAAPAPLQVITNIAVTPDTIEETAGETVTIAVGTAPDDDPAVAAGTPADEVTIVDNNLRVSVTGTGSVDEGGNAVFTVTLSGDAARPDLVIPYAVTGIVSADVDVDNSASLEMGSTLTISTGETARDLTYVTLVDDLVEGTETAQIELLRSNLPAGLLLDAPAATDAVTADITIGDATPALQVSFSQADYRVVENDGNTTAVLSVLSGTDGNVTLVSDVTISVATVDGTADADTDYTAREETEAQITIRAGVYSTISRTIEIPLTITPDDTVEHDETFTLNLDASDSRVDAVEPDEATVTIENDDATAAAITFDPAAVTLASEASMDVTVGTNPSLTEGQSVRLGLTAVQGLTVGGVAVLNVDLDDETTTQTVTVAASEPGDYQVMVAVNRTAGLIVTTTTPLMVTVPGIVITQTDPGVLREVTESQLQASTVIDTAIGVALFGGETISTISVTIDGTDDGDLMGAVFEATTVEGFNVVSGREYTSATGATATEAQNLLRSLSLTLATQNPPTRSTVTVTVTPSGDSGAVTVEYPLNITDENEPPTVTVLPPALPVEEDSGELAVNIAIVDPVEPDQTISANIAVVASTITVISGGGDLLQESIANLFSVVGDGSGTATVTFTGTPVANAHGTAEFALQATDGADPSPVFLFTLTVNSVNDAPVVTVTDDLRLVGGSDLAVTVDVTSLSDVDVSEAAGNEARFAQADDTLVMRMSTDVVTLTLDTAADADIEGSGTSEIRLTFTSGLTAAQVEELIESVQVSAVADATPMTYELTIELETGANEAEARSGELTGIETVQVRVFEDVPPTLESVEAVVLDEGNTAADAVRLELSRPLQNSSESVTVTYTLDFSGASATPTDVTDPNVTTPNNGQVTLNTPGEDTISIQLQANADDLVEGGETFVVRYTAAFTGVGVEAEIANDEPITVTISDGTPPLQVSFSQADYPIAEDAGNAVAVLNVRSGAVGNVTLVSDVSVSVATTDRTAMAPDDYTARADDAALVVITAGDYSITGTTIDIPIPILNDDEVEPDEIFVLNLIASDPRAVTEEPDEATVTIENDDVGDANVVFTPEPVEVARGGSVDVTVSLDPPLISGQEATLRLMTDVQGLTMNNSTTLEVVLNDLTPSPVVAVAVASDAQLGTYEVTVEVLDGSVGVTVTLVPLRVTVIPAQVQITPSVLAVSEPPESELRMGILIDAGIEVGFVSGSESISTIRVTYEGSGGDDLAEPQFSADVTEGFTVGDNEYTSATGATASQAQALLQSLRLTLDTEDPPDRATVTVTVQSLGGFSDATEMYPLDIVDENAAPRVTELLAEQPIVVDEDSEQVVVGLVIVDPVEADQTISDEVTVAASTITASNGGTAVSDLLQGSLADLFNADNNADGPATVTFTGTPQPDAHGTAEFALRVKDSGGDDLSSTFLFTLTVRPVNDAPEITVDAPVAPARLRLNAGDLEATVEVTLSDVDVSAVAGNGDRFAQADDTLAMSMDTNNEVTLTLQGLAGPTGDAMLNGMTVATVAGNASSRIALTFTRGLSATRVETLVEMVEVRAVGDAESAEHVLTIELTTGVNEARVGNDEPMTGSATVPVRVFAAGETPTLDEAESGTIVEGTAGAGVTLRFGRDLATDESVTVTYTLDFSGASATETEVTDPNNGEVVLNTAGEDVVSIQLQANADANVEGEETFIVQFTARFKAADGTGETFVNAATRTVTISDATPPLQVSFSEEEAYTVDENAGPAVAVLNVRSDGGNVTLVSDVSVSVATADGTAEAGTDEAPGDYTALDDAQFVISAGEYSTAGSTIQIPIPITDDDGVEPVETFALNLDAPDSRAVAVEPVAATVMIVSDDATAATVVFTPAAVTVRRGNSVDVEVSLDPPLIPGQEATLRLMTPIEGLTVNNSLDVMLDDRTGSQDVTVAVALDAPTGTHEVTVAVLDGSSAGVLVTATTLTVEILEAEVLTLGIVSEDLDEASTTVGGVSLTLMSSPTLTLRPLAEGESLTINYALVFSGASATAADAADISEATTGTVTLTEGETIILIPLTAVNDGMDESPETFGVQLTAEFIARDGDSARLDDANLRDPVQLMILDARTAIRLRLRVFLEGALQ